MSFLQLSGIGLKFGEREILKNVTLNLRKQSRAALAGANGCGKTTLMKIAAGLSDADSGDRTVQKNCRIVYLPQSGIVHKGTNLREEADKAFGEGYRLYEEMEKIAERLKTVTDEKSQAPLLERYQEIADFLNDSKWYYRNTQIEQVLAGLGFSQSDFTKPVEEFSGGWQMRIALAKALLQNPDILLLDEPTNYLDIEARTWLEEFLLNFSGGFLLVSHDRYFLDTCVNEVYELFNAELHRYAGNFSAYEKIRKSEMEGIVARYELQQEKIRKTEEFIRRFRYNAAKAAQVQERIKQLEKTELIEIPEALKKIRFAFPPAPHSGRIVLNLEKIGKTYTGVRKNGETFAHTVLQNIDLTVEKGERIVVTGCNGAGKTTLLRILAQEDAAYDGNLALGANVSIGYFSQDNAETLKGDFSVIDMLEAEAPTALVPKLRDMLAAFLFRGDDIYKSVNVLSGGEKSRLALLRLLLRPVNLLILDEPTNHLDIHSKDALLHALESFGGTVVFISHDRSFTQSLATRILELDGGRYSLYPGPYDYYMEQRAKRNLFMQDENVHTQEPAPKIDFSSKGALQHTVFEQAAGGIENVGSLSAALAAPAVPLSYEEQKKLQAARRKLEKEEKRLMDEITQKEERKAEFEAELAKPEIYSDVQKSRAVQNHIEKLSSELDVLNSEWEKALHKLETFLNR
ncbi:ABC-F family ATP-binding cassette domain-containing protein [Treponema sp. OMZ 840]|uniref:ABC-F family ATP-binding cassette domain-containing protein n=1 Tax=Treponema sp. OMZ 840 TaxID=244313 RepID=UPI003D8A8812